jgi:hypothetical protein
MSLTQQELKELQTLEESLWIDETRFDNEYMEKILAPDFFEFGRSGRVYKREDTLAAGRASINAVIPLKNFQISVISDDVVLVTYISEVQYEELEVGNRSSLWLRTSEGWKLKFHQGTPVK